MKRSGLPVVLILAAMLPLFLAAQTPSPAPAPTDNAPDSAPSTAPATTTEFTGWNAYASFRGNANSTGTLLKLNFALGYDFNSHIGVFAGLPVYFAHDAADDAAGIPASNSNGLGDFYFGGEFYVPSDWVDYTSTLTLEPPTGNQAEGFSTGHFMVDWSNRFRHNFGLMAPYFVAGLANTVPDTETLTRAFSSYGKVIHLEEGTDVNLTRRVYVGGSFYQIFPFGNQVVVSPLDGTVANPAAPTVVSGADLTRENGFDTWAGFEPSRTVRTEVGYSRSVTFAINRFTFGVSFNVGRMLRLRRSH